MRWAVVFLILLFPSAALAGLEDGGSRSRGQDEHPPLLESYAFEVSGWPQIELTMLDSRLGGDRGQFRFDVRPLGKGQSQIRLEVFRHVPPDAVQFALLLEEVRLVFADASGRPIRTIVLDESLGEGGLFIIGDSNHGYFQYRTTVAGLQGVERLEVQLFGNYE